jgi:hypothetical protein
MSTLECSWEEFKQRTMEFHLAAPTLALDELDNAFKALSLSYLGMREDMWQNSAAIALKFAARTFVIREAELEHGSRNN